MILKRPNRAAGDSRSIWPLLVVALVASASAMLYLETGEVPDWNCSPLATGQQAETAPPCFGAMLSGQNTVSLRWRLADNSNSIYIFDDTAPNYIDPGYQPAPCVNEVLGACELQLYVEKGGSYRWTIQVADRSGRQSHASAEIFVPPMLPPTVREGGGVIDMLAPSPQRISWSFPREGGWVEISYPGALVWSQQHLPHTGPGATLEIPASTFHSPGDFVFQLRGCLLPVDSADKFCSPAIDVGYKVAYDHFTGGNNRHVPAGKDLEVAFTTRSGNVRLLSSDTLLGPGISRAIAYPQGSYTIPGERVTAGAHKLELNSCLLPSSACSNRVNTPLADTTGALWHLRPGFYAEGEVIARLYPADGSERQIILAPASGPLYFHNSNPVDLIKKGDPIAFTITQPADVLRLLVDAPVEWTLDRPYTEDFYPGSALSVEGFGQALDISFDDAGGIWLLNEFSNNLEHVSPEGELTSFNLPLARSSQLIETAATESRQAHTAVRPFTYWQGSRGGIPSTISTLAERIVAADGRIWFSQGGGLIPGAAGPWANRSRVFSFDARLQDSPDTPYDDRFCAYNMPADDESGLGNNQVIGVTLARGRVWVAESRGILNSETSYLSSFVPDPELCENLVDFEAPQAHTLQRLQYCGEGRTPEQDGCVQRIALPTSPKPVKIAHLEADPEDGLIWFTDASGQCLGRYDMDGETGIILSEFKNQHEHAFESIADLGGFPWDIQVTREAVYVGEYASRHILRFDKASQSFHEIGIPFSGPGTRLHSLEVDSLRQRLWFSLSNECAVPHAGALSTIGYVDLASWQSHIERGEKIQGVIYSGLGTIPSCDLHPGKPQAFRGIAINPRTGKLAIATMLREQITLLQPLPGFWP